jgi:hypothetical protein
VGVVRPSREQKRQTQDKIEALLPMLFRRQPGIDLI